MEQAAAYTEQTSLPLADYLTRYRRHHARLLERGQPDSYPATVATTWQVNLERVAANPATVDLLRLAAFLAPEPVPPELLTANPSALPRRLATIVSDEFALDEAVATAYRYWLVTRDHDGLRMHRLVGQVIRASLSLDDQQA